MTTRLAALATTLLLTAGLAGCSGGGDATASSDTASSGGGVTSVEPGPELQDAQGYAADADTLDPLDAAGVRSTTGTKAAAPADRGTDGSFLGRDVVATAEVTVRTRDVGKARDEVGDLLRRYVGYVASERTERNRKGDTVRSVLQLRVPTPRFDAALADLDDLAPQVDIDRKTEDVTQQVVDVASRIRTQEVSLQRLRGFLGKAATVDGIVRLESEIAQREGDLGSLRAQQRELKDLTSESTITVRLQHVAAPAATKPDPKEAGFVAGLSTGWHAFTVAAVGLSRVVGVVLPFALLVALLGVPGALWWRRRVSAGSTTEGGGAAA
jgi:hypothetical protein